MKPTLYILGDSISLLYGPFLDNMLADKFEISRKKAGEHQYKLRSGKDIGHNGGNSRMVLDFLQIQKGKGMFWDYFCLNCGLHDIVRDGKDFPNAISPREYGENLENIVALSKDLCKQMVWIRTTPIEKEQCPGNYSWLAEDVDIFNDIADEVMKKADIPVIDLNSFVRSLPKPTTTEGVHYKEEILPKQAAFVAENLTAILDNK